MTNSTSFKKRIGSFIQKVEHRQSGELLLSFSTDTPPLSVPTPWSFNSCLVRVSSGSLKTGIDTPSDLIGLIGAELSNVQTEGSQIDLLFGSITISATFEPTGTKSDLANRDDIICLVDRFYEKIRSDEDLGPVFEDVVQINWEAHLPKMYDFWDTVLFRAGTFRGDPIGAHAKLVAQTDMSMARFEHWLTLFRSSVHELFEGENATHIIRCAEDMANVLYSKVNGVPDPRFTA